MTFLRALLLTVLPCAAAEPVSPSAWTDSLPPEALQEIFRAWKNGGNFDQTALNRAALAGLAARDSSGVTLRPKAAAAQSPVICVFPGGGAPLYIRPRAGPDAAGLAALDAALSGHREASEVLLLDLRSSALATDPALLASLISRFVPKGLPLFTQDGTAFRSEFAAPWEKPVWLLLDGTVSPEAELVAAVLRHHRQPLTLGSETAGRAAPGREFPIDDQTVLRVPSGAWKLPDGASAAGQKARPSLPVPADPEARARLFAAEDPATVMVAAARPRFSEAALVARENPEIPWRVAGFPASPGPDPVLQAALDLRRAQAALENTPAPH